MQYIIPDSLNVNDISFSVIKDTLKYKNIYKIYYRYRSIELIGVPFMLTDEDYKIFQNRIIITNELIHTAINNINDYIISIHPTCTPIIHDNTMYWGTRNKSKSNLYIIISSVNTYKNTKKANIHFIYER